LSLVAQSLLALAWLRIWSRRSTAWPKAASRSPLPLLWKDFVVDEWQVATYRRAGVNEIAIEIAGYNSVSRHIVYAGGCDKSGKPKDTRTAAQKEALKRYVRDFHERFPWIRIVGHHELNPGKACPSFDVASWLREIGIRQ